MRFAWPYAFLLLLLVPVVLAGTLWARRRRGAALRYSSLNRLSPLRPTLRQRLAPSLVAFRLACVALLAVAMARPQEGVSETRVSTEGIAIEMVVDRSGSMQEPMDDRGRQVSKLDVTKRVFREFLEGDGHGLEGRPNDIVGLVAFARFAETVCPLTRSRDALVALVDQITPAQLRMEAGTAIGDGIALAAARLKNAEEDLKRRSNGGKGPEFKIKSKAIILLTDGQNNAGEVAPEQAAKMAREWGIKVYAIGVGGEGRFVRTPMGDMQLPGEGVDMATLEGIASETGGRAWRAVDASALREAYAAIDRLERSKIEAVEYTDYTEAFAPLAIGAAAALLCEMVLGATWLRRIP